MIAPPPAYLRGVSGHMVRGCDEFLLHSQTHAARGAA
jgi:hypothetical protein